MTNAPAVTARRATKRIVRAPALLVLAAIVVAEQVARAAIMLLIGHAVMDRLRIGLVVTAIGHTRHVPLATAKPARRGLLVTAPIRRALRATGIRVLVVTATTVLAIRAETATPRPGLHVPVAIVPILRAPLGTVIRGRPVPVGTVLTLRVLPATATLGHAATATLGHPARATTALAFRVVTEIHVHLGPAVETVPTVRAPRAMEIPRVGRRALVETAPIRRAPPETARARTDLEAIVRIVRARIVHMAISRAVSGSPMGGSVARSARR